MSDRRRLAESVAAAARRAGAPPPDEGRRYRPHVTLARSKQPANLGPLVAALGDFGGMAWDATTRELIKSHTGPPTKYQPIGISPPPPPPPPLTRSPVPRCSPVRLRRP